MSNIITIKSEICCRIPNIQNFFMLSYLVFMCLFVFLLSGLLVDVSSSLQ